MKKKIFKEFKINGKTVGAWVVKKKCGVLPV